MTTIITTDNAAIANAQTPHHDALTRLEHELCHGAPDARRLGTLGERYAQAWLERRGWTMLACNWQTRYGELDLVMLDPHRIIVFVEVKTRRSTRYGTPQEAVTARKRLNLRRACVQWLTVPEHRIAHNGVRCDVVTVSVDAAHAVVHHIPEAF